MQSTQKTSLTFDPSKLQTLRKERGVSTADLINELSARGIQCNPQALSRWENGKVTPHVNTVLAICTILNVDIKEMCECNQKSNNT